MINNKYIFPPQKKIITSFHHYLSNTSSYFFTINHIAHFYFLSNHSNLLKGSVTLISPDNAATYMGIPWWLALIKAGNMIFPQPFNNILDCYDNAGLAIAALRLGQKKIFFIDLSKQFELIQARASSVTATVLSEKPQNFDLTKLKIVHS